MRSEHKSVEVEVELRGVALGLRLLHRLLLEAGKLLLLLLGWGLIEVWHTAEILVLHLLLGRCLHRHRLEWLLLHWRLLNGQPLLGLEWVCLRWLLVVERA